MFVLLHPGTNPDRIIMQLDKLSVNAACDGSGLWLTGETWRIDTAWLRQQSEVIDVLQISGQTPLCSRNGREDSVVSVGSAKFGGGSFGVIAGPCAVESEASVNSCANVVVQYGGSVLRGGAFKPRTSPYHFQGMGQAGLQLLCQAGKDHGLPVIAELMSPEDCETLAQQVDMIQIGARNMQNYPLLRAAGMLRKPVVLKRSFCATQEEWLMAAEYILSGGNTQVILCERGIRTFEAGQRFTLDLGAVASLKRKTHLPIIVDPSHAAGRAALVTPLALAAVCAGADGLMIEVHPNPECAFCDGQQALDESAFASLMDSVGRIRRQISTNADS